MGSWPRLEVAYAEQLAGSDVNGLFRPHDLARQAKPTIKCQEETHCCWKSHDGGAASLKAWSVPLVYGS